METKITQLVLSLSTHEDAFITIFKSDPSLVNQGDSNGMTMLMVACLNSRHFGNHIVSYLLKIGVNPNIQDKNGNTALITSSQYSAILSTDETVQILIRAGADVNIRNGAGFNALMVASGCTKSTSTENTVKMLIDACSDLDKQEYGFNRTALMYSVAHGTVNTTKLLIDGGANIFLRNKNGSTATWLASRSNDRREIRLLLEEAERNKKNN